MHSLLYIDKNDTVDTSCSTGDVRLVGGSNDYEGRVEMCYNQMWGTISQNSFSDASDIVCKQLGHQSRGILFEVIVAAFFPLQQDQYYYLTVILVMDMLHVLLKE